MTGMRIMGLRITAWIENYLFENDWYSNYWMENDWIDKNGFEND